MTGQVAVGDVAGQVAAVGDVAGQVAAVGEVAVAVLAAAADAFDTCDKN